MSDHERYEPKTRGEHKEGHGPEPDFPEPSQHWQDLNYAISRVVTVYSMVIRGLAQSNRASARAQYLNAVSYAEEVELELESRLNELDSIEATVTCEDMHEDITCEELSNAPGYEDRRGD